MTSLARELGDDRTVYPVEDDVGEHELQTYILELLRPLLAHFLAATGQRAHVGSDQFIYWQEYAPTRSVAPDIYVLPGVPQSLAIDVWKVWQTGVVPSFALEVVTSDFRKDYEDGPRRYAELGVAELVVFDPFPGPGRITFQIFRRDDQELRLVERTAGDRVRSRTLGCWLRVVGQGNETRLRVATDPGGDHLVPTAEERAEGEALAAERERAEKRAALTAKDAALTAKDAALARVAELEAELARRR